MSMASRAVMMDFPLCADPRRDQAIRPVVERAVTFLLDRVGADRIEAVILTGSLSRGEGSVVLGDDGARLLGDAEFLVVWKAPFNWPDVRRRTAELGRQATRELGCDGRVASIEYGPSDLLYLQRNIRPCIFAYDLLHHGKVVWGRADILTEVRPFGVVEIPPEDAVELIMNRMVELLMLEETHRANDPGREARAYHVVKITLDLAGSALAFAGQYVSSYAARAGRFASLLDSIPDLRAALPNSNGLLEDLDWATRCKLAPTEDLLFRRDLQGLVAAISTWAKDLWLWETRQWFGRPAGRFMDLVDEYVGREPRWRRVRGWAKFCLHPLRPPGALSPLKLARFLLRASPQTLTYAAALLIFWSTMGERRPGYGDRAAALLPVRRAVNRNGVTAGEVGDLWHWLVRNN